MRGVDRLPARGTPPMLLLMLSVKSKLEGWERAGLISGAQREAILLHEREGGSSTVIYSVVGLGVLVALTGVVSLVAANWDQIPVALKLGVYFLLQSLLGTALVVNIGRAGVLREALLTAFCLFFLAGIGLAGQIFHLQSDGWQAILFWLALTFGATLLARTALPVHLWLGGLALAGLLYLLSAPSHSDHRLLTVFSLDLALIAAFFAEALPLSRAFTAAGKAWSLGFLLAVFSVAGNLGWYGGATSSPPVEGLPALATLALALAALWKRARPESFFLSLTVLAMGILVLPPLLFKVGDQRVVGCVLFLLAWSAAAAAAARARHPHLFDAATFVVGVRFVVVYFEVFGSLSRTGLGLLVTGLLILLVAYLWTLGRRRWRQGGIR